MVFVTSMFSSLTVFRHLLLSNHFTCCILLHSAISAISTISYTVAARSAAPKVGEQESMATVQEDEPEATGGKLAIF